MSRYVLTTSIHLSNIYPMDEKFKLHNIDFVWNKGKSKTNLIKHGLSFEQAVEAFFDPFLKIVNASRNQEERDAIIGMDKKWDLLFVVHIILEQDQIRIISARKVTRSEKTFYEN